jgi:hypothetical protein
MKNLLWLIPCFLSGWLNAQTSGKVTSKEGNRSVSEYLKGYIVLQKGDTVYGRFKDRRSTYGLKDDYVEMTHPDLFHQYVLFSGSSSDRPKKYTPKTIRGFRIASESYYGVVSEGVKGKGSVFARPLAEGVISLYARRMPTTQLPQEFYLKKGISRVIIRGTDSREKLAVLFEENEALNEKILSGDFTNTPEEMLIMVRSYNDWFQQQKNK